MDYKILKKDKLDKIISNSSVEKGSTVIDIQKNFTYDRTQNINYLDIGVANNSFISFSLNLLIKF